MPIYSISGPDGRTYSIEGPPGATREQVIQAIQERLEPQRPVETVEPPVAVDRPPATERTAGEAVKDIGASLIRGAGALLEAPGQLVKLVPGLQTVGETLAIPGEALSKYGESLKSQGLRVREALRSQALSEAEKDGILAEFGTAITSTIKDPALISTFFAEQLPLLLGPGLAARAAKVLGAGRVAALPAEEAAAKLGQYQTRAAIGAGAGMQAADISSDTYNQAYQIAINQGKSPEQANAEALNAARLAAAGAGVASVATTAGLSRLGGATVEKALAGVPGTSRVKGLFGEAGSEALEESAGQLFSNIGLRTVDPSQSLTQGIGTAAGLGALGGAFFGTMLAKPTQPELAPGQQPGETLYDTANRLNAEIQSLNTLIQDADKDAQRQQVGLKTSTELVDMYREEGYGAVKQYQIQLEEQAKNTDLPKEQRAAAEDLAKDIGKFFTQIDQEEIQRKRVTQPPTNVLTDNDVRVQLGIASNDPMYQRLVGKNLGIPEQAQDVLAALDEALQRKGLRQTQRERFTVAKETINEYLSTIPGSGFYEPVAEPSREGAGVAGVSGKRPAARRPAAPKPTGVVRPKEDVGQPLGRKVTKPVAVSEEAPAVSVPPAAAAPVEAPTPAAAPKVALPADLKGAKPRYAYGPKQFQVEFESDLDKALFITAQKTPSKRDADYRKWLVSQGYTQQQIAQGGTQVRNVLKNIAKTADPKAGPITLPTQVTAQPKRSLKPGTEARAAEMLKQMEAEPEVAEEAPVEAPTEAKTEKEQLIERRAEVIKQFEGILNRILAKYGLKDVKLDLQEAFENEGSYARQIITLALNVDNPIRVLRHESIHALKDMGFFTDAQWNTLVKRANDDWINVLKNTKHDATRSRYDAYVDLFTEEAQKQGLNEEQTKKYIKDSIVEEAIADAFGAFEATKPPPGLMNAIRNRMSNLFKAIKEAFGVVGIQSAEDIFGKIEEGKLKPTKDIVPPVKAKKTEEPEVVEPEAAIPGAEEVKPTEVPPTETEPEEAKPSLRPSEENARQATPKEREQEVVASAKTGQVKASLRNIQTDSANFKKWSNNAPIIIDTTDYQGGPAVFKAFHGTTYNDITVFDTAMGSKEGSLGAGPYLSTSVDDVNANYAGVGPDLTIKISRAEEKIGEDFTFDDYLASNILSDYFSDNDLNIEVTDDNFSNLKDQYADAAVQHAAVKQLKGKSEGVVVPAYVRLLKPFDMRGNQGTRFTIELKYDAEGEPIGEPTGSGMDLIKAIGVVADSYNADASELQNYVFENQEVTAKEVFDRASKAVPNLYDDDGELVSSGQFIQDVAKEMGFDGLIQDAYYYFGAGRTGAFGIKQKGMDGVYKNTLHIMPFSSEQIKSSVGNIGTFGQEKITEEQAALLGMTEKQAAEAQQRGDIRLSLRSRWSDARIDSLVRQYGYTTSGRETDAKAYAAFIRPQEFLNATASKPMQEMLREEIGTLDVERLAAQSPMHLVIKPLPDGRYQIADHEGRHRMMMLSDAGYTDGIPVVLQYGYDSTVKNATDLNNITLRGQRNGRVYLKNISIDKAIPISWNNRNVIKETFGGEADVKFSLRAREVPKDSAKEFFKASQKLPRTEGIEAVEEAWSGGVADFGDRDAAQYLGQMPGYSEYASELEALAWEHLAGGLYNKDKTVNQEAVDRDGRFYVYRYGDLNLVDEINEGSYEGRFEAKSTTLSINFAKAFANFAAFDEESGVNRGWMRIAVKPEAVIMVGSKPSEMELVVDLGNVESGTAEVIDETFQPESPEARFSLRAPETPQFKFWFGNSKIVDKDGKPKVMYHGTGKAYEALGTSRRQAKAIFVTDEPDFAQLFAIDTFDRAAGEAARGVGMSPEAYKRGVKRAIDQVKEDYGRKPEGKELIADIRKGYTEASPEAQLYMRQAFQAELPAGPNIIPVYVKAENPFDYDNADHVKQVVTLLNTKKDSNGKKLGDVLGQYIRRGVWGDIEKPAVQDVIKQLGFDSFYVKEGGKKSLAVYNPNQLKSVFNEAPTERPELSLSLRSLVSNAMTPNVTATINKIAPPRYDPSLWERILNAVSGDSFTKIRSAMLNRYEILARYDRRVAKMIEAAGGARQLADAMAEPAALFSDLNAGLLESALGAQDKYGGAPVFRNGVTVISSQNGRIKGPILVFKPLADLKDPEVFRLYQVWVSTRRAKRLTVEGREELFDAADIAAIDAMAKTNPALIKIFEKVQKDWQVYNDALVKYMVDTGVISQELAKKWTQYGDYFPFYRLVEEDVQGPKGFKSLGNVKPPKALKGGENPLGDFFENIVRNSKAAIEAGTKNVAAQRATQQALLLKEVTRLPTKDTGINVYRVLENGKEVYYRSHDPLFINAIKSLNMPDLPFIGLLSGPANILRNLVTKDPAFMLANMMRDSLSAWTTSGVKMTPMLDTAKNFAMAIANRSPETRQLYAAGVLGGYDYSRTITDSARAFEKKLREVSGTRTFGEKLARPFTSVWGALEKGTQASDAATRAEVYKRVLKETGNEAEAYWQALEVMNFNRRGSSPVVRVLTAAIPFLNARMQGLDLLYRTAIYPTSASASQAAKERMKSFWVRGMTIMSLSSMYWLLTHDDDEYKKQEQETRDNYWLIPSLGIKLPIPFEVGVVFKVIPERIMGLTFGDDTHKDFTESMKRQFTSTFGFNFIPQVFLPGVEVATNHSFFTQRPIIGKGLEDVAPAYQIGPSTSKVAQAIGQSVGYSPIKIDHLIKGYTGTIGTYAVDVMDMMFEMTGDSPKASKRFEQMPVIRRFALDPEARGTVTAYYSLKDSVDEAVRTSNLLQRTMNFKDYGEYMQDNIKLLASRDYLNALEKDMKQFREMKNMIRASNMSADQKRDSLISIGQMEQALTNNIQTIKKAVQ